MIEATEERLPKGPNLSGPGVYMSGIDAMSRKELENRFPEAQEALVAIETKLEEPTGLRNAAVILAAAMLARSPP
jgi:hypothetical protein